MSFRNLKSNGEEALCIHGPHAAPAAARKGFVSPWGRGLTRPPRAASSQLAAVSPCERQAWVPTRTWGRKTVPLWSPDSR